MVESLEKMSEAIQNGRADEVKDLVTHAIEAGVEPKKILDEGLIDGMSIIGDRFKRNEVYIPEVLIAARAMHAGMGVLEPLLIESGVKMRGKLAIGTVKGDLHDIGKNLVGMMFKGAGFNIVDLGVDCSAEKFMEADQEHKPDIIGLSALLTTTMTSMKMVVDALKEKNSTAKVIIGGAPVTQSYADEIGADGYAADAATAVELGKALIGA